MSTIYLRGIYPHKGYFIHSKMDQSIFGRPTTLSNISYKCGICYNLLTSPYLFKWLIGAVRTHNI